MITKFKKFTNENKSDEDVLKLMYYLDKIQNEFNKASTEYSDKYIDYEFSGNILKLSYGFNDVEEHSHTEYEIKFDKNKITLVGQIKGYSVMDEDGDYSDQSNETFNNVDELIKWLDLEDV